MSNNNLNNEIDNKLSCIKDKPFRYVGRVGNLAWLGFGKDVISKNYRGEEKRTAQYSLHIQCPFRISCNGKKKLGSADMYEPNSDTGWSENFNWDKVGTNLYDEKALLFTQELSYEDITVTNIKSNAMGDVQIYLSNYCVIEIFTNTSSKSEEWRFFETGIEKKHFVVTGKGIEEDELEI